MNQYRQLLQIGSLFHSIAMLECSRKIQDILSITAKLQIYFLANWWSLQLAELPFELVRRRVANFCAGNLLINGFLRIGLLPAQIWQTQLVEWKLLRETTPVAIATAAAFEEVVHYCCNENGLRMSDKDQQKEKHLQKAI